MNFFVHPTCQWPVDDSGARKAHAVVPAWYVGMAKKGEDAKHSNMAIQWNAINVCGFDVHVPSLVNTRALKQGEVLKRPWVEQAPMPPAKKARR